MKVMGLVVVLGEGFACGIHVKQFIDFRLIFHNGDSPVCRIDFKFHGATLHKQRMINSIPRAPSSVTLQAASLILIHYQPPLI